MASELRVNKSHLWQYLIAGLGQDFYLTDAEMERLSDNLLVIHNDLCDSNESDLHLIDLLSRVLFKLNASIYFDHRDACSWDFADRRVPCRANWFKTRKTMFGNSHTFNYDGRFTQIARGPGAGLRIDIDVQNNLNSGKIYITPVTTRFDETEMDMYHLSIPIDILMH